MTTKKAPAKKAPAKAAAPPKPKKGDQFRYTGGVTLTATTDPPFTVQPGDQVTAESEGQALVMAGHADFEPVGGDDAQSA